MESKTPKSIEKKKRSLLKLAEKNFKKLNQKANIKKDLETNPNMLRKVLKEELNHS